MGRARQEWGQQQWQPGTLGRHPQEWREPGPKLGPKEQSEQPISQVGEMTWLAGVCQGGMGAKLLGSPVASNSPPTSVTRTATCQVDLFAKRQKRKRSC